MRVVLLSTFALLLASNCGRTGLWEPDGGNGVPGASDASVAPIDAGPLIEPHVHVKQVSAGGHHTCAVTQEGAVKCWGRNEFGQLGTGSTFSSAKPVEVVGLDAGVFSVVAGPTHTCSVSESGAVKCWGDNAHYQLGNIWEKQSSTPMFVEGLAPAVRQVALSRRATCALLTTGGVRCFGGSLGPGGPDSWWAENLSGFDTGVTAIAASWSSMCANFLGAPSCWGTFDSSDEFVAPGVEITDRWGALSSGGGFPFAFTDAGSPPVSIAGGGQHYCALLADGRVECWGNNSYGELGNTHGIASGHGSWELSDGTGRFGRTYPGSPVDAGLPQSTVRSLAVGPWYSCAVRDTGAVTCWGDPNRLIGKPANTPLTSPNPRDGGPIEYVDFIQSGATQVSVGETHVCAIIADDRLVCWGRNEDGQLGNGTTQFSAAPVEVRF